MGKAIGVLILIFILIAAGCAVALYRWRWGVFAAIAIGLLQDPLRKMVPDVPGYLSMTSLPVWMATVASSLFCGDVRIRPFLSSFPLLSRWIAVFGGYLLIPAAVAISYGENCWQIALLGAVIYAMVFLMISAGWAFPRTSSAVAHVLMFYVICGAVLLIGGPLDVLGYGERFAAIGTQAMGHVWVTYRTGTAVYMYAGFFRGPDVMGWHAALLTMLSCLLAVRSRGWMRAFWLALAVWGVLNIWICGRRKMVSMLPVFGGILLLLSFRFRDMRKVAPWVGGLLLVVGLGFYSVTRTHKATAVDTFYMTALNDWDEKMWNHGVGAVAVTIRQAGFWGYGLGMSQQGVHHIKAEKPRLWQEGGPGKLVAELGVPGAMLLLGLGAVLLVTAYHVLGRTATSPVFYTYAGLFSILGANVVAAVVSAQIFGDPFIMLLLSFLLGILLSGARRAPGSIAPAKLGVQE